MATLSSPNLKTLELIKIKLPKGDSNGEAILRCPVSETLILKQCHYCHLKVLNLSVNRLKQLEIDNSPGAERFLRITGIGDCKLHLNTPNLSSFVYKGVLFKECSFGNLVVLVDVQLFLCPPFVKEHVKFLQGLKGARPVPLKGIENFRLSILRR
ncbi:hypothetical protein Sjap_020499 [Stephania japonica]|uniref:Uncharacterized protein n=1 Tax=Stephania japonica TaxID=461633 RepID=A0AAP0I0H2_9MAGN